MSDLYKYDFKSAASCTEWLNKKFPYLSYHIVSAWGPTSSGKSSLMMSFINAIVASTKDTPDTSGFHFMLGISNDQMSSLMTNTATSKSTLITELQGPSPTLEQILSTPSPTFDGNLIITKSFLTKKPKEFDKVYDKERYGRLYVNNTNGDPFGLEQIVSKVLPHGLTASLPPRSHFTVYNVDMVTTDPKLKLALRRTVLIDTKGIGDSRSEPSDESIRLGSQVIRNSSRNIFVMSNTSSNNKSAAREFESIILRSVEPRNCDGATTTSAKSWWRDALQLTTDYSSGPIHAVARVFWALSSTPQHNKQKRAESINVWSNTLFVRTRLDETLNSSTYQMACQDAGTTLGYFTNFPTGVHVRQVAVPEFSERCHHHDDLKKFNEWEQLREQVLFPRDSETDLCDIVEKAKLVLKKQSQSVLTRAKTVMPHQLGCNTDEYYLEKIWESQCKK
eukprot:PhF_6_TR30166/c1_g2_i2/m.44241